MNLSPKRLSSDELNFKKEYICPLSHTQSSSKNRQALWVLCPLVEYQPIGESTCYAYQAVARAKNFETHPQRNLFNSIAVSVIKKKASLIRKTCLLHQKELINQFLAKTQYESDVDDLLDLLAEINFVLENMQNDDLI